MLEYRMHDGPLADNELIPGTPIYWWDEVRGGYGALRPVIAVLVCVRGQRIGIAALKVNGTWVPHWTVRKRIEKRGKRNNP